MVDEDEDLEAEKATELPPGAEPEETEAPAEPTWTPRSEIVRRALRRSQGEDL